MRAGKIIGFIGVALTMVFATILSGGSPAAAAEGSIYNVDIAPLTIEECGRCHFSHFTRLKELGAKHQQVACTECHEQFHVYNPMKNNYAAIMPQCSSCHDAPHGTAPEVAKCLDCHTDPHQPLAAIPDPANLEDRCRKCHGDISLLLTSSPSKHTEEDCSSCHSRKHGRIPQCNECHENHSPMADLATPDCMACHPVHTPLAITYPETQSKAVCAGCHDEAFALLKNRVTKHTALTCAKCHPQHGLIPACQTCHGEPHGAKIHKKYGKCGTCHGIAHDVQR